MSEHKLPFRWYITATAMREYLKSTGLPDDDGGPNWGKAEQEINDLAHKARETGHNKTGTIYRTGRVRIGACPRARRLEFTVQHNPRGEGDLPQLVKIRFK